MPAKAVIHVEAKYRHKYAWNRYVHNGQRVLKAGVQVGSWTPWRTRRFRVLTTLTRNEWATERLTTSTRATAALQARRQHDLLH